MQLYHNGPLRKQMRENGSTYLQNELLYEKAYETIMRKVDF